MVNAVSRPVVTRVVTLPRTFARCVAGVVADESGAAHQQVKQEAEHLHADGDEEEDERVPPLVVDQQLGEDARQRDDHPCSTWVRIKEIKTDEVMRKGKSVKYTEKRTKAGTCVCAYLLSPVITPCVYLLGSIPM